MNVTVLTCACDRPEAWKLSESYMSRQTVKPAQWLVLDDDENPTVCTLGQEYHYWPEMRGRGSLAKKIRRALKDNLVKGDAIVFWENDDFYSQDYIEWCIAGLKKVPLFGEGRALYYTVRGRFFFAHTNLKHASLCATSLTRPLFPWLLKQCEVSEDPFIDVRLWNRAPMPSMVADPDKEGRRRNIGIKAMPGRPGYGGGHRGRDRSAKSDYDLVKLRELIGDDAELYAPFYVPGENPPAEKNGHTPIPTTRMIIPKARSEAGRVHGPNWVKWLGHLAGQPNVVGLEIGTFEGDSAEFFLENIVTGPGSHYHCVDPFTGSVEHHIGKFDVSKLEETTRAKLAKFSGAVIHKGYSQDVLRTFPKDTLSFCYVDGSHSARDVLRDAVLVFDLLKVDGIGIFDDLTWAVMPNELDRPRTGIMAFVKCYGKQLRVISQVGSQLCFRKIAE